MTATGRCLCGAIRIECDELGQAGYCHCEDCRRVTGSAFNVSLPCPVAAFRVLSGELGSYRKLADSGRALTRHFCVQCGSPIYTSAPGHPDTVYVKAGILDDPGVVEPVLEAWTRSKVTWAQVPEGIASHSRGRSGK